MTGGNGRRCGAVLLAVLLAGCSYRPVPEAEQTPSPSESALPLAGMTVAVDAGHNGGNADHPEVIDELVDAVTGDKPCDTTGTETDDGYSEHEFTFDVAQRLRERLETAGATVVMVRDDDSGVGPCITERAAIGNDAGADAAVSIHADGGPDGGRGFHIMEPVLLKGHTDDIVEPSDDLARTIAESYPDLTGIDPSDYIGDDGINPRDDMAGLNLSTVPKVMVECGNMRNTKDADILSDADGRESIAEAIATGITDFLRD